MLLEDLKRYRYENLNTSNRVSKTKGPLNGLRSDPAAPVRISSTYPESRATAAKLQLATGHIPAGQHLHNECSGSLWGLTSGTCTRACEGFTMRLLYPGLHRQ